MRKFQTYSTCSPAWLIQKYNIWAKAWGHQTGFWQNPVTKVWRAGEQPGSQQCSMNICPRLASPPAHSPSWPQRGKRVVAQGAGVWGPLTLRPATWSPAGHRSALVHGLGVVDHCSRPRNFIYESVQVIISKGFRNHPKPLLATVKFSTVKATLSNRSLNRRLPNYPTMGIPWLVLVLAP